MNPENQIPQLDTAPTNLPADSVQVVSDPQATRASAGDTRRAAIDRGDIIGSARALDGSPLNPSELTADSIVTVRVEGRPMEMRVREAEMLGFLAKTGGDYSATTTASDQQKQTTPANPLPTEQPEVPELFDTAQESEFVNLMADIPSTLQSRISTEWIHNGSVSEATLREAANAIPGSDPEKIRDRVRRTIDLFGNQAHAAVSSQGVNSERVFAWADQHHPDLLNQAMEAQVISRTTKGYQKVVDLYLENLDTINPKGLLAMKLPNGVSIHQTMNGKIMVHARGGSMSWAEALRYGVVKVKGAKK